MHISEVSEKCDISPDTLRYYERIGLLPPVRRSKSGLRDYDETDVAWVEFIKCMRTAGLPIEQLVKYVQLFPQGDATHDERKQILLDQRQEIAARIAEMQNTLDLLDRKIDRYESGMMRAEQLLARGRNGNQSERS